MQIAYIWVTMKNLIVCLLLVWQVAVFAQNENSTKDEKIAFQSTFDPANPFASLGECPYNIKSAEKDIQKDSMAIIIHGGFLGFGDMDGTRVCEFQEKYNVEFVYVGCNILWDPSTEDTYGYNEVVFNYLAETCSPSVKEEYRKIWN